MLVAAPAMAATEVAGVKPAARWNGAANIMGTLPNLVLADGTATTASVMWNSPSMGSNPGEWMVGFADMPGNTRMMNGYLDPVAASMPAVVTVSGLPASITGGGYDVYVYVTGDVGTGTSTRTYNYAIGTTMFTVSQTGPTPTSFTVVHARARRRRRQLHRVPQPDRRDVHVDRHAGHGQRDARARERLADRLADGLVNSYGRAGVAAACWACCWCCASCCCSFSFALIRIVTASRIFLIVIVGCVFIALRLTPDGAGPASECPPLDAVETNAGSRRFAHQEGRCEWSRW